MDKQAFLKAKTIHEIGPRHDKIRDAIVWPFTEKHSLLCSFSDMFCQTEVLVQTEKSPYKSFCE